MERTAVLTYCERPASPHARRGDRALISATYHWTQNRGFHHGVHPTAGLIYRNPEPPGDRYITDAELQRLIDAAPVR